MIEKAVAEAESPFDWFAEWYQQALKRPVKNPSAMGLSTVSEEGRPSSRVVLLKEWDTGGFVFYTNLESRKAVELDTNPFASLLFYWDDLGKQIRIEGSIEAVSREQAQRYFKTRPIESQWGAWASMQSRTLSGRSELEERYQAFKERYPDTVPLPGTWGGYRLIPDRFEFWQSSSRRLHHRCLFEKAGGTWVSSLLYP